PNRKPTCQVVQVTNWAASAGRGLLPFGRMRPAHFNGTAAAVRLLFYFPRLETPSEALGFFLPCTVKCGIIKV
ncbi:MAG: hypothetical protein KH295_12325, partial [Clostridiaceae bacterium]|nr:hypothetical protein [Clostridiaceae bacterium]